MAYLVLNLYQLQAGDSDVADQSNSSHYLGSPLGQGLCQCGFNPSLQACKVGFVSLFPLLRLPR